MGKIWSDDKLSAINFNNLINHCPVFGKGDVGSWSNPINLKAQMHRSVQTSTRSVTWRYKHKQHSFSFFRVHFWSWVLVEYVAKTCLGLLLCRMSADWLVTSRDTHLSFTTSFYFYCKTGGWLRVDRERVSKTVKEKKRVTKLEVWDLQPEKLIQYVT